MIRAIPGIELCSVNISVYHNLRGLLILAKGLTLPGIDAGKLQWEGDCAFTAGKVALISITSQFLCLSFVQPPKWPRLDRLSSFLSCIYYLIVKAAFIRFCK